MTQTVDNALTNLSVRSQAFVDAVCVDRGDITAPFAGFKQSGFGRDKSIHALDKYTDLESIWIAID
jgi:acyl-CoA reductase-like NAD-dependent aldehyde dehydrogenase